MKNNEPQQENQGTGPTMGDLRAYIDFSVSPGMTFTADDACRGVGAYNRGEKKTIYVYLSRLVKEGVIRQDNYRHGGFRRVQTLMSYDLTATSEQMGFNISLPLGIEKLIHVEPGHLIVIAGRYDSGKTSFLFDTMQRNFSKYPIYYFATAEITVESMVERMDALMIPRPHDNIKAFPMNPGYEDSLPGGQSISMVDYIRTNDSPRDIDVQFYRILENLKGGICLATIQKNIGVDRPTGGQFAMHAPHHVILLDRFKGEFICKIGKSKSSRDLEGVFITFKFNESRKLIPVMDSWKKGDIKWDISK